MADNVLGGGDSAGKKTERAEVVQDTPSSPKEVHKVPKSFPEFRWSPYKSDSLW